MTTNSWKSAVSDDWSVGTDWSLGHVPLAGEDVQITVAGGYIVTISTLTGTIATINSLTIGILGQQQELEIIEPGVTQSITGSLTNNARLVIDDNGSGGSTLTIGGTLLNSGNLDLGNGALTQATTLRANGLTNTGGIFVFDGTSAEATLDINTPAPTNWTGRAEVFGNGLIEFSSGSIATIASSSTIVLWDANARIADAGSLGSNSALTGLTNIAGVLDLEGGAVVATGPGIDLTVGGGLFADDTSLTIGGTLTNNGSVGFGGSSNATTVTAEGFVNNDSLSLGSAPGATFNVNAAAPTTFTGSAFLGANALLNFASGNITNIGTGAELQLDSAHAFVATGGMTGSNSALLDLVDNAGSLVIVGGAVVATNAGVDLNNTGSVSLNGGTLAVGGRLINSGVVDGSSSNVTAAGLINIGTISTGPVLTINGPGSNSGLISLVDYSNVVINGTLGNSGTVSEFANFAAGVFDVTGAVSGTGAFSLGGSTAVVEFGGAVGSGETVAFAVQSGTTAGTVKLDNPSQFSGTITGMIVGSGVGPRDQIDLTSITSGNILGASLNTQNDVLSVTANTVGTLNFQLSGSFAAGTQVGLATDAGGAGTDVFLIACFCRGTQILTVQGEVAVEELVIGDKVVTVSGFLRPIKWIGQRSYDGRFIAGNPDLLPVVVKQGALADGVPVCDLWLSPGHGLFLDGVVVPVAHLVNGMSIVRMTEVGAVEYFHIELDSHDILLAAEAAAESYVDVGNRAQFQNAAEFRRLYPEDERPPGVYCVPFVEGGETLAAIRRRLLARLPSLGWPMTEDCDVHLVVDGRRLDPDRAEGEVRVFAVPAGAREVLIASRAAAPRDIGINDDLRRLGIMLRRMTLRNASLTMTVGFDAPSLTEGFHASEATHRWTDGCARVPDSLVRCFEGGFTLELDAGRMLFYPVCAAADQRAVIVPPPSSPPLGRQAAVVAVP